MATIATVTGQLPPRLQLRLPPIDSEAPKTLRQRAEVLGGQIADLLAARKAIEDERQAFHSETDEAEIAKRHFDKARDLCIREVQLLQREIRLREELAALDDDHRPVLRTLRDKAVKAHQKAEERVRDALVSIGYADVPATAQVPSKITPGMIQAHPDVRAAYDRNRQLQEAIATGGFAAAQREAIDHLRAALDAVRQRLTTI